MGCVKLHILDEQYKRTELRVSYFNKELTQNFCAENPRRCILIMFIDPDGRKLKPAQAFLSSPYGAVYNKLLTNKPYKIKIKNGCWYIKKTGKWQLFYSPYKIATPKLKIYFANKNSWWFDFKAVRTDTLFGYNCIIYEMIPITIQRGKIIKGFDLAHLPIYWFSSELGIIKIQTGGATNYIREDIISYGVTL